jgi:transcriptional regulator
MYRPRAFAVDDPAVLHDFIRAHPFATIAMAQEGSVLLAYAPVVLEGDAVRFHLAAANPMAGLADGAQLKLSFMGPHAYISPDWYETAGMVPTWNYSAVEGEGIARRLAGDDVAKLLIDLSAVEEAHLAPKTPWTIEKVPREKMGRLLAAIVGFSLTFASLEGKFKLSQNAKLEDAVGAIRGLDARGDTASLAVAADMRRAAKS